MTCLIMASLFNLFLATPGRISKPEPSGADFGVLSRNPSWCTEVLALGTSRGSFYLPTRYLRDELRKSDRVPAGEKVHVGLPVTAWEHSGCVVFLTKIAPDPPPKSLQTCLSPETLSVAGYFSVCSTIC